MAATVQLGYATWQDGMTFNGQLGRTLDVAALHASGGTTSALTVQSGVLGSVGGMQVVPVTGLTISVSAGFCVIASSTSNLQGGYRMGSMQSNNLTVSTADPTNPRIDLVCATISDPGTNAGFSEIQILTGTPAVSPVAPSLPTNSLSLATISVPANTTTITSGLITDTRVYTSTSGGATNWPSVATSGPGFPGLVAYDRANDRFFHNNVGTAGVGEQMAVLPFAPVKAGNGTSISLTTSFVDMKTLTFTTDGNTDVKLIFSYPGVFQATASLCLITFNFIIDSTSLQQYFVTTQNNAALNGVNQAGQTIIYTTGNGASDTPTAGTHTWHCQARYAQLSGSGSAPAVFANASPMIIQWRVEAVTK